MKNLLVTLTLVILCGSVVSAQTPRQDLIGTWELVSRLDRDSAGRVSVEPKLGADPRGVLIYDSTGHVAAQLMARGRTALTCPTPARANTPSSSASAGIGDYDAYFGHYEVDPGAGTVTHVPEAALAPGDIGRRLVRHFRILGDTLWIHFDARAADGTPVTRTITWSRVSR